MSTYQQAIDTIREALSLTAQYAPPSSGYDWNADPLNITLKQGAAFEALDTLKSVVHPGNPKPQTYEAAMMAYEGACRALSMAIVELGKHI